MRCKHCNSEYRDGAPSCICERAAALCPGIMLEHAVRCFDGFKTFWGDYPDTIPQGFTMPGDIWASAEAPVRAGENYVIYGPAGNGKTTALKAISWQLWLPGRTKIRGGAVPRIMHKLKGKDMSDYRERLEGGDILFLDDLDKILGSRFEIVELFSLTNEFFARGKSVVVSMNTTPKDLSVQLKSDNYNVPPGWVDSFLSRLMDKASLIHLKSAPDHRTPKKEVVV